MTILMKRFTFVCLAAALFAIGLSTIVNTIKTPRNHLASAVITCQMPLVKGCN